MNKLKKYLTHSSISQKGFAKKVNTTPNNLSLLVRGKSTPGIRLAYEIERNTGGLVTMYDWILPEWRNHGTKGEDETISDEG